MEPLNRYIVDGIVYTNPSKELLERCMEAYFVNSNRQVFVLNERGEVQYQVHPAAADMMLKNYRA